MTFKGLGLNYFLNMSNVVVPIYELQKSEVKWETPIYKLQKK
jgi:hypothetical protein